MGEITTIDAEGSFDAATFSLCTVLDVVLLLALAARAARGT